MAVSGLDGLGPAALAWRDARVKARQAARLARWRLEPAAFPRPTHAPAGLHDVLLYRRSIPIARRDGAAHPHFEDAKRTNLALAAPHFDGLLLGPDRPLSFWRTLGRVTEARGYRHGMELRGGCIVPSLGGGLCLLSNALFEMAARLGWRVLERHGHSLEAVPPGPGLWGLDATVFWPYVDLRVAPPAEVTLGVRVEGERLVLDVHGDRAPAHVAQLRSDAERVVGEGDARFRENRVLRQLVDPNGLPVGAPEVVAVNRRRVLDTTAQRQSCFTCGDTSCQAAPARQVRAGKVR